MACSLIQITLLLQFTDKSYKIYQKQQGKYGFGFN